MLFFSSFYLYNPMSLKKSLGKCTFSLFRVFHITFKARTFETVKKKEQKERKGTPMSILFSLGKTHTIISRIQILNPPFTSPISITISRNHNFRGEETREMATLQKFKLLATQCGVVQSPTRSPTTSPVVHFHRRKSTLRMLLTRTTSRRGVSNQEYFVATLPPEKKNNKKDSNGRTLKDLFGEDKEDKSKVVKEKTVGKSEVLQEKLKGLYVESGSPRPGWVGFRHRLLLKRAWRPMLVSIPE